MVVKNKPQLPPQPNKHMIHIFRIALCVFGLMRSPKTDENFY